MANLALVVLLMSWMNNQGQIYHTAYLTHIHSTTDHISGYWRKKEFTQSKNHFKK
jgi:hypothetical protein